MKTQISVPDMMCHNCEKRLAGLADKLPGVKGIVATHETHLMEVEYDETLLSIEQVISAVEGIGFHPELVSA
jgi:copper chaperone CopZ